LGCLACIEEGYILAENPAAVVIGGANIDIKVQSSAPVIPATSNPGTSRTAAGGVARNIAENLARLGTPTHLIAAIGADPFGERLLRETRAAGVQLDHIHRSPDPTGTYTAILDADGELVVAVADMSATDHMAPHHLDPARDVIGHASLLILDGNLSPETLSYALDLGQGSEVPTIIDPVSVSKAARLTAVLGFDRPLFAITPNIAELEALVGRPVGDDAALSWSVAALHDRGIHHVWVRLGPRGSLLATAGEGESFLSAPPVEVHDITGAGDSMLAAFAYAFLQGQEPVEAARFGHAAAALTIASPCTVRPDLSPHLIRQAMNRPRSNQP
jgi:pseudouridine kinase